MMPMRTSASRILHSWSLFSQHSQRLSSPGPHVLVREVRTRALITRRRTATAPVQTEATNTTLVNTEQATLKETIPLAKADTKNLSSRTLSSSQSTPPQHRADPADQTSKQIKPPQVTTAKEAPRPDDEVFSRKLQAFPFVPGATTTELTKSHKFFLYPAIFVKSASEIHKIPDNTMIPEVAFIGRSNVGKSSLINGLVNRKNLVKTSSKPGHTRLMNFFKIGEKLSLVDMPGYGWKSRDEWGSMIMDYLRTRSNLRRIYILVDPSHGLKDSDLQIIKILDSHGLSYQVILTKADRLSKTKYQAAKAGIEATLVKEAICCFPLVLGVSSKEKNGMDELRAAIVKAGQLSL